jgi:protocatechuate 4,5-dioxygenase beta chain
MANIVGMLSTSHIPAIGGAIAKGLQHEPYWKPFFDGFPPIRRWLADVRPDVAVVFYNDHGLNFFLDNLPAFAVGAALEYRNEDEGWGIPSLGAFPGDPELSWHLIEQLVKDEFDIATCQQMKVDHAFSIPLKLLWPDSPSWPVRTVPIAINTVQHPLPSTKRCLALGHSVNRALQSYPTDARVLIVGTGGLSHQLDGERAGFINKSFDQMCLDVLVNHPEALSAYSNRQLVELSGTQGVELLMWIAARGALGGNASRVQVNYHIPISNTAAATLLLAPAA